jgi:hypothetical protein
MPGPRRAIALSLSTLLACGCGAALAADPAAKRPLQLKLASAPATQSLVHVPTAAPSRPARFRVREASLGERALSSLLDDADTQATTSTSQADGASFRFNRRGNAGRDLAQGYNNVCDAVSRKVWDDPKGKRVKFDVAGKPGVGIEIPLR